MRGYDLSGVLGAPGTVEKRRTALTKFTRTHVGTTRLVQKLAEANSSTTASDDRQAEQSKA